MVAVTSLLDDDGIARCNAERPRRTAEALVAGLATDRFLLTNNDRVAERIARLAANLLDPRAT